MDNKIFCHDCKKEIEIKDGELVEGKQLVYRDGEEEIKIFKCNECFEKDPSLHNYRKCEVYSRIVGYIRPVNQWNQGKRQEYDDRTEYTC
jgi:anaerobic ribonucleoside-triphosphate reductase